MVFCSLCFLKSTVSLWRPRRGIQSESEDGYSYIRNALTFMYGHYKEAFSVRELASHCCISESHLRRLFKNMVGISPLECLQHYRIQQACHLIHLNQKPVNSHCQAGWVCQSFQL